MDVIGVYGKIRNNVGHPMETELKKLQRFKSYGQIKIFTEIRANFLCIFALSFNKLEGPLRMLGFVSIFLVAHLQLQNGMR